MRQLENRSGRFSFGKIIEQNLIKSLRMAGIPFISSPDLDHNYKIDFMVMIKNQKVGVQVSLRNFENSPIKVRVAKICALEIVPRFIYLIMAKGMFNRPDVEAGKYLHNLLEWIIENYSHRAMILTMDLTGFEVRDL